MPEPSAATPSSARPAAAAPKPLSLGVIFLTLYIDLIGFSVAFPLVPKILEFYLDQERHSGLLGWLLRQIESLAPPSGDNPVFVAALLGGVLSAAYSLLQFLFAPVWGARSDLIGRRPVLLLTVAGNALSYLIWAFSGSFLLFVFSRILGGAMSGNLSVATAAVADVTSREGRAKGMGLVGAAFGLGFITGPAIGGIIGAVEPDPAWARFGLNPFSAVAFVAFGFSLLNLFWIALKFRETLPAGLRTAPGVERTRHPLRAVFAIDDPAVRRANLVYFLMALSFAGFEMMLSFYATERLHYSEHQLTYVFVFVGLMSIFTQGYLVRRWVPRLGEKAGALGGVALIAAGCGCLGVAHTTATVYGALTLVCIGSGFANVSFSSLISLYSRADQQGHMLGVFRSLGSLARAVGPVAAGVVFWWFGSTFTCLLGAALLLVPVVTGLSLPQPVK
ncbi:MAG: MFS transporter [Opitutaceae bacterium]|nr:MFS transporter [Opitutaceae bacterium]